MGYENGNFQRQLIMEETTDQEDIRQSGQVKIIQKIKATSSARKS